MSGRGAWNNSGVGGTINYDKTGPGPYYAYTSDGPLCGSGGTHSTSLSERAVAYAVLNIQRRLKRVLPHQRLVVTGKFDQATEDAVALFQQRHLGEPGISVWGGIGPDTMKTLFLPVLKNTVGNDVDVCGFCTAESGWDLGAVGYVDDHDLGFMQINGPAHPTYTEAERFNPRVAFGFCDDYLTHALTIFDGDRDAAVASYNLGIGGLSNAFNPPRLVGAKAWVADGKPNLWTPPGQDTPRDVRAYYTKIETACATIGIPYAASTASSIFPATRVGVDLDYADVA